MADEETMLEVMSNSLFGCELVLCIVSLSRWSASPLISHVFLKATVY